MGVTLALFLFYHCTLIARGVTTNERIKINSMISYYSKEAKRLEKELPAKEQAVKALDEKSAERKQKEDAIATERDNMEKYRRAVHELETRKSKGFFANLKRICKPESYEYDE
jgi:phosphoenolpyruvate carboxylase